MPETDFVNLLIILAIAVLAPLSLGFVPRLRVPAVVLEIVLGIVVGPSGLGWVEVDLVVEIVALLGLAFLLFLAGLEIDVRALRGPVLRGAVDRVRADAGDRLRGRTGIRRSRLAQESAAAGDLPVGDAHSVSSCPCSRTPDRSTVPSARPRSPRPRSPTSPPC